MPRKTGIKHCPKCKADLSQKGALSFVLDSAIISGALFPGGIFDACSIQSLTGLGSPMCSECEKQLDLKWLFGKDRSDKWEDISSEILMDMSSTLDGNERC